LFIGKLNKKQMIEDIYVVEETDIAQLEEPVVGRNQKFGNPNVPFVATQEEWWEHIKEIEAGPFYSLETATQLFEEWKKDYLARKL
jgi:hypothetical protein